jgi:hypothetical protein
MTPVQRLQASRQAIMARLQAQRPSGQGGWRGTTARGDDALPGSGWWSVVRDMLGAWWQNHPAHTAAQVVQPVLSAYAQERPLQVVGIAAGLGAALVVFRPWRLVSIGALVAAALKSPAIPGLFMSLLASDRRHTETAGRP